MSRRGFGYVRRLPSKRYQASYAGPDLQRHVAPTTFTTKGDAEAWLAWLQWDSIHDYALPVDLEQSRQALLARFPHHRPRALNSAELLAKARTERGDRSWFLLGPSDLGLWS